MSSHHKRQLIHSLPSLSTHDGLAASRECKMRKCNGTRLKHNATHPQFLRTFCFYKISRPFPRARIIYRLPIQRLVSLQYVPLQFPFVLRPQRTGWWCETVPALSVSELPHVDIKGPVVIVSNLQLRHHGCIRQVFAVQISSITSKGGALSINIAWQNYVVDMDIGERLAANMEA